jgi:hypothetical protein
MKIWIRTSLPNLSFVQSRLILLPFLPLLKHLMASLLKSALLMVYPQTTQLLLNTNSSNNRKEAPALYPTFLSASARALSCRALFLACNSNNNNSSRSSSQVPQWPV